MEFIEKYARVEESEDEMKHDDDTGGDEVNQLDLDFTDDEQIIRIRNQQIMV